MSEVIANMKHCPICNRGHQIGEKCEPLTDNDQKLIKYLKEILSLRVQFSEAQKEIERLKNKEHVLFDIHDSLGIKWGDNPYKVIDDLKKAEAENAALRARLKGVEEVYAKYGHNIGYIIDHSLGITREVWQAIKAACEA